MKITVLLDNNPHPTTDNFLTEHGLSIYFEFDGLKWLIDTGASDRFYTNARLMGVDISEVDYLALSHGHFDHTGGLEQFIGINSKARIYLSSSVRGKSFFSYSCQPCRNIGIDAELLKRHAERFVYVDRSFGISRNVGLITTFPNIYGTPKANACLKVVENNRETADDFSHEIVTVADTPDGLIIFSGCSHCGLLNILHRCSEQYTGKKIAACIGGTHLVDSEADFRNETDSDIIQIARTITELYPEMKLITGHCTGKTAAGTLSGLLGDRFTLFYSGFVL